MFLSPLQTLSQLIEHQCDISEVTRILPALCMQSKEPVIRLRKPRHLIPRRMPSSTIYIDFYIKTEGLCYRLMVTIIP